MPTRHRTTRSGHRRARDHQRPAFFRLASTRLLAVETQDYVPKLIAAALIAKQPARFGITAPLPAPFTYDSLVVTSAPVST